MPRMIESVDAEHLEPAIEVLSNRDLLYPRRRRLPQFLPRLLPALVVRRGNLPSMLHVSAAGDAKEREATGDAAGIAVHGDLDLDNIAGVLGKPCQPTKWPTDTSSA
jgi:hypothetical protein